MLDIQSAYNAYCNGLIDYSDLDEAIRAYGYDNWEINDHDELIVYPNHGSKIYYRHRKQA